MIVNHKYKFIFIKTKKTAGTSIEIALSQFCGEDDILTGLMPEDEQARKNLGFRGKQNYGKKSPNGYCWQHMPSKNVKKAVGDDIWNSYFKFCFERNPFDRFISEFYWGTRKERVKKVAARGEVVPMDIDSYIAQLKSRHLSNWYLYTLRNKIAVDFVGRYENLSEDLEFVRDRLGLPELHMTRAKGGFRTNRDHYSKILSKKTRARVEKDAKKEILEFGYQWCEE